MTFLPCLLVSKESFLNHMEVLVFHSQGLLDSQGIPSLLSFVLAVAVLSMFALLTSNLVAGIGLCLSPQATRPLKQNTTG